MEHCRIEKTIAQLVVFLFAQTCEAMKQASQWSSLKRRLSH